MYVCMYVNRAYEQTSIRRTQHNTTFCTYFATLMHHPTSCNKLQQGHQRVQYVAYYNVAFE